jgi:hypothetical protein
MTTTDSIPTDALLEYVVCLNCKMVNKVVSQFQLPDTCMGCGKPPITLTQMVRITGTGVTGSTLDANHD